MCAHARTCAHTHTRKHLLRPARYRAQRMPTGAQGGHGARHGLGRRPAHVGRRPAVVQSVARCARTAACEWERLVFNASCPARRSVQVGESGACCFLCIFAMLCVVLAVYWVSRGGQACMCFLCLWPNTFGGVCLVLAPDVNFFLKSRHLGYPCWRCLFCLSASGPGGLSLAESAPHYRGLIPQFTVPTPTQTLTQRTFVLALPHRMVRAGPARLDVVGAGEGAHATFAPRGWKQRALSGFVEGKMGGHVEIEHVSAL